jgi:hypothetical protein
LRFRLFKPESRERRRRTPPPVLPPFSRLYSRPEEATMQFPRFLFRVKDRQIEDEAQKMVDAFGIGDVEIRRDDTIDTAWLEDYKAMKTTYGLDEIRAYLETLTKR